MARLKPGVAPEQARAEIDPIFQNYMNGMGGISAETRQETFREMHLTPASKGLNGLPKRFSKPLAALMAVVALVLLIACTNITNLLLARASVRRREFAVHAAIGAGRGCLFRQLMTEKLLLFGLGAGADILFARWSAAMQALHRTT